MTEQCYASGINPSAIPGDELDPDAVEAAARALAADGAAVRDAGADVLQDWRGLALHYEAPEAPRLFSVMDPVETNARRFGDDVESVAGALRAYAEEIRPIKASLAAVRADAWGFRSDIASEPEWEYDQDLVDRNTALVARVNTLQVRLWEAERRCANAIRALYGAPAWRAATAEGDPRGYGVDEIPTDAAMPWGSDVQRKDHCPKSAAVGVKRFVWDGVVVDGLWGTVTGLGLLVGIDGSGWSWETMSSSWVGMGSLIGYSGGEWSWGNAGDAWTALGKGLIAYDTWDEDPARAAGGAVFNLATILIPAGAAVTGTKTAGTAAGTAGRTATLLARGARVVDFVDPVALGLMGGRAALPKIGDMLADMRLATQGLGDSLRVPEAAVVPAVRADLEVPVADLDGVVTVLDDLDGLAGDLPPVRDPDVAEPVPAPTPQPEPALVGGPAHEAPGGLAHGADDLHQPPNATTTTTGGGGPATTGGDGAAIGGAVGTDPTPAPAPGGTGWPETPTSSGGGVPSGTGWPGDAPGGGAVDDLVGDGGGPTSPDAPGTAQPATDGEPPTGPGPSDDAPPGTDGSGQAAPTAGMLDLLHDGHSAGDGWRRLSDEALDPDYGFPRADAGEQVPPWASPPAEASPGIQAIGGDAARPWGHDPLTGAPLTEQEWVARYTTADGAVRWPANGGSVPGTRLVFEDAGAFTEVFGDQLDRVGRPSGQYLGVPPGATWSERAITPDTLAQAVHRYEIDRAAASRAGVEIHVSQVAPAFGQPGGGIQVRFFKDDEALTVEMLVEDGVLR